MSDAYLGEIRLFAFGFATRGWLACEGQTLPINGNEALYTLVGSTYGATSSTFNLPDLRGKVPIHFGAGITLGAAGGDAVHTLTTAEMPSHSHTARASSATATSATPAGSVWAKPDSQTPYLSTGTLAAMSPGAIASTGGNGTHNNMQPYLPIYFAICVQGEFPSKP
ncbi:tail fiber protein [Saccharibacillus sp. CPCC 101409]|uniref:phage tail protein n=1 Tax=Saccharibacillus sp. CPCC 101409 TaxID=3058041 RepID=UPI0026728D54|nr:tail fiber protein [Saccharibacillus sp. CPCC 101409]MDO3410552.1 tail fiber protein [Saccharibacillus sp. CPCC 101409]